MHGYSPLTIVPYPSSVALSSDPVSPIIVGSAVTLTCTVELGLAVVDSDLSLLMVEAQLTRDGTTLTLTGPKVTGTTFTYTIQLDSFSRNDSGKYICTATVTPQSTSSYLTGSAVLSKTAIINASIINYSYPTMISF